MVVPQVGVLEAVGDDPDAERPADAPGLCRAELRATLPPLPSSSSAPPRSSSGSGTESQGRLRSMAEPAQKLLTYGDYVRLVAETGVKHEYVDGVVYAMSGGTVAHAILGSTVQALLHLLTRGRPCRVHSSDQRIRVPDSGRAFYPDAAVTCGRIETDPEDADALVNPVLVVEVLSPTTERDDRVFKLAEYMSIPSVRAVLLVRSDRIEVQRWRKDDAGDWGMTVHGRGEHIPLPSLDARLAVDELYADVGSELG